MPLGRLLVSMPHSHQQILAQHIPRELHRQRQPIVRKPARQRDAGQAGKVERYGVAQVPWVRGGGNRVVREFGVTGNTARGVAGQANTSMPRIMARNSPVQEARSVLAWA